MVRIASVLLLVSVAVADAQPHWPVGLRRSYGFGTNPYQAAVADFNRDGKLDLAVVGRDIDSVTVRLGDGHGNFGAAARYATGSVPTHVTAGDLDGDGILELIVANSFANTVSVLRGQVFGTFGPKKDFNVGTNPQWVVVGDANSDTRPDVVTANIGSNDVTVLVGGAPSGLTGTSFTAATHAGSASVEIADMNSDGLPDLVVGNQNSNRFSLLRGTNTGSFLPKVDFTVGDGPVAAVGDWNGDGAMDVATANQTSNDVSICFGDGAGNFSLHEDFPVTTHPTMIVPGDLDGDGAVDLVVGTEDAGELSVLLQTNGTFFVETVPTTVGKSGKLTVADVDGDGARDVVTLDASGVEIAYGGLGLIGASTPYATASLPFSLAAGDLDGDGDHDLLVACQGGSVTRLLGTDEAAFPTRTDLPFPFAYSVTTGDLGADGFPEVVATAYRVSGLSDSNRVALFPNGGGTLENRIDLDIGSAGRTSAALGKLNGDAHRDLVVAHYNPGEVQVFLGNGANGFTTGATLVAPFAASVNLLDLNGNATLDLVVVRADGHGSVFLGNGAGDFGPPVTVAVPNFPSVPAIADFDLDGHPDLAMTSNSTNISINYGNNTGSFQSPVDVPAGPSGAAVAVCAPDLNVDGIPDLVYGHGTSAIGIRMGQGNRTFGPIFDLPGGTEPDGALADDLDQNGTTDVAFANVTSNDVTVFHGLKRTRTTLTASPSPCAVNVPLHLTATVTPETPDSAGATGNVRFFDGFKPLGTAPLVAGVAQLTVPAVDLWERALRAEYVGDNRFHGSFSRPVAHYTYVPTAGVVPRPLTLSLAALGNPIRQGETVRVRVSLAGAAAARLTLHDVRGRVLASRELHADGVMELAGTFAPGVYLVKLEQGGQLAIARAVVL